ncbi:MAG: serine/threonine protein kinase [Ktedonobacteraceae bacterium]
MSDLEGVMLSDYLLLQCISKGGLADVYRARQNGDGNYEVAVKVYRSGYAQEESFRNYFMAEAEKIGQFDHPNILPFLEFGEGEPLLYVVTPFVAPGMLEDLLVRVGGRFSAMQALPIMQQLCSAVQYTHNHDAIHGNIKPTNVFVAADGRMLLSDFGIAHRYDGQQSFTNAGWGSAEYAAPEQSLGVLRRASDIYALGVLLFRILTGQSPFTGQTAVEVLLKHVRQQPPSARSLVPNISDAVDGVICMAMQKSADDRFTSAEELSNAFLAAVTVAPVASPVASRPVVLLSPQPALGQPLPVSAPKNSRTPVPAFNASAVADERQTPVRPHHSPPYGAHALPPLSSSAPGEFAFLAPALDDPNLRIRPTMEVAGGGIGADVTEMRKIKSLEEKISMGKAPFWSVDPDPVEWSPIANAVTPPQEMNAVVPLTADAYLRSKPHVPEDLPAGSEGVSVAKEADRNGGNRFNEGLRKALPIVVVVLLLLGLLGALLSSFFFPSDGPGAYVRPMHGTQHMVVNGVETRLILPIDVGRGQVGTSNF